MSVAVTQLSDHLSLIDTNLLETDGFGATYVVHGDSIALIETGTSLSAPVILAGLEQMNIAREAVEHILLTHVHMDHAGGAGALAQTLPNAAVYIHSMTAQHLVEPSRLLKSVERAVGEMWAIYGTIVPLDPARLRPAEDMRLDLGQGIVLESLATPGHSPDHLAFWDASSGTLWAGDAIGIVMSTHDVALAVTPPPAFDLKAQYATFEQLRQLPIQTLLPSHFGPAQGSPNAVLERMEEQVRLLEQAAREQIPLEQVLERVVTAKARTTPQLERVVIGTTIMSLHGMNRYLEKAAQHQ